MESNSSLSFEPADGPTSLGLQIAPLIDIVFLLICFFMLATQLIQTQADPTVQLPQMSHSKADRETPAEVIVNVRKDGSLVVNGVSMPIESLNSYLAAQSARHEQVTIAAGANSAAATGSERLRVVIRADREQRFDQLDKVLNSCRQAGIDQIILRAEREDSR